MRACEGNPALKERTRPIIAITTGDPAGIGPEVTLKALSDPGIVDLARWILVGDAWALEEAVAQMGLPRPDWVVAEAAQGAADRPVRVLDRRQLSRGEFVMGRASAACGRAAREYVRAATQLCLDGQADAMVTAPLNKEAVALTGERFSGHTEYIAALCGAKESRMLLVNDRLRVVHVSTHVSLRQACNLDTGRILRTIEIGHQAMRWLGMERPRIAVCGLNPHAGENGLFGEEDRQFIRPAVEAAQERGILCEGPVPADTVFLQAVRGGCDLIVAMYHDQGHIPAKLLDFERTVNVSLGLPIIRTSVDHGTAFDIAGKNLANADSMKAALRLAVTMVQNRALSVR